MQRRILFTGTRHLTSGQVTFPKKHLSSPQAGSHMDNLQTDEVSAAPEQ
jgi:hypothetical protein